MADAQELEAGLLDAESPAVMDATDMEGEIEIPLTDATDDAADSSGILTRTKNFVLKKKGELKPWSTFLAVKKMKQPKSITSATGRLYHNLGQFQANYIFLMMFLAVYCVVTTPMLLVALGFLFTSVQYIYYERKDRVILGQTIKKDSQVQLAMFVTIPLLWFSAAGSAVFWVIGASLVIVMGHSMMLPIPSESLSDTILEGIV